MRLSALVSALAVVTLLAMSSSAFAQDPTTVTFPVSTDHATKVGTADLITRYDAIYKNGSTVLVTTPCPKQTPVTVAGLPSNTCAIPTTLPANVNVTVTMASVWSGGSVAGPASDPFVAKTATPAAPGKPTVQ